MSLFGLQIYSMSISGKQGIDLAERVRTVLLMAEKYNECLKNIDEKERIFFESPAIELSESLVKEKLDAKNFSSRCFSNITNLLDDIDSILKAQGALTKTDTLDIIPSKADIERLTNKFFREKIREKTAPYPKNCGCYAYKGNEIRPNTFVCAKYKNGYYLMLVHHKENDMIYGFIIADQSAKMIQIPSTQIEVLPSSIPDIPRSRWEFSRQSKVLSLIPEGDKWSSVFYEAMVVKTPYDRIGEEIRGYELSFSTEETAIVPEQYVARYTPIKV